MENSLRLDQYYISRNWVRAFILSRVIRVIGLATLAVLGLFTRVHHVFGQKVDAVHCTLPANLELVPQNLLGLIHDPIVQKEIGIPTSKLSELEEFLVEIDGPWWLARHQPRNLQREVIAKQESELAEYIATQFGKKAMQRLRQIEWQSQGMRALMRDEVANYIELSDRQYEDLGVTFKVTDEIAKRIANQDIKTPDTKLLARYQTSLEGETQKVLNTLKPAQRSKLGTLIGASFDLGKIERTFPMAPHLIQTREWVDEELDLDSVEGNITILFFTRMDDSLFDSTLERLQIQIEKSDLPKTSLICIAQIDENSGESIAKAREYYKAKKNTPPILLDVGDVNSKAWGNKIAPTVYVIDQSGYIRRWFYGDLASTLPVSGFDAIRDLLKKLGDGTER